MSSSRTRWWTGVSLAFVLLLITGYGLFLGFRHWFPPVFSDHGHGVQRMLSYTEIVTGLFFAVGHLAFAYMLIRFTFKRISEARPATRRAEKLAALVPALLFAIAAEGGVIVLGLPVWAKYYGPPPADAVTVEITGRQFFWAIRYPGPDKQFGRTRPDLTSADNPVGLDLEDPAAKDDIVLLNEMAVPVNRPVRILLKSMDVIHSFFLPEFRVKQDAVPGMTIQVWFVPKKTGDFEIACNQICGLGHYRMRGFLYVMSEQAFQDWLAEQPPLSEYY